VEEAARVVLRDWQNGKNTFYLEPEDYGLSERATRPVREHSKCKKTEKIVKEEAGSKEGDVGE